MPSKAFQWVKPEIYPLFAALGLGIGACIYSSTRNFLHSPEVRVYKSSRADGASEDPALLTAGKKYKTSFYRMLGDIKQGKTGIF
ncbi:g6911 [Coccomyxa elongata]